MAIVGEILQLLGLNTASSGAAVTAANRLALCCPTVLSPIAQGAVVATSATLDRTVAPRPRVVEFIAPETSLRGLGQTVRAALQGVSSPSQPPPDALGVTRAILTYNQAVLTLADAVKVQSGAVPGPLRPFPAWITGVALRLPIELDAGGHLITDMAVWASLATKADPAWDAFLDMVPYPLDLPNHDADRAWANSVIAANADLRAAAAERRTALLGNPSSALYPTLMLLDAASPAAQLIFAAALTSAFFADELALLAATLPGAVVLRALYRRCAAAAAQPGHDPGVDAAITALNTALGLPGTTAADLTTTTPTVEPAELPVSQAWMRRAAGKHAATDQNGEPLGGSHTLVHGRDLYGGKVGVYSGYSGPAYLGNAEFDVATWGAAHGPDVTAGADAKTLLRLFIVEQIANNEGHLDATRLQDRAILSIGLQQWSAHVDNELSVLLWGYAAAHPDDYDTVYGIQRLRTQLTGMWSAGPGFPAGAPKTVALQRAVPGAPNVAMAAVPDKPDDPDTERLTFFGGAPATAGGVHFRFDNSPWAGFVRSAARCARSMPLWEISFAIQRFDRILAEQRTWTTGGTTFHINDLITSKQGAAQLLDQHINAPGKIQADIRNAVHSAGPVPAGGPDGPWLTSFEAHYMSIMRYGSADLKLDHTTSKGVFIAGRQDNIKRKHLDATPHSFDGGW